jgi:tetratricopeptide (TPR) repeat protein
MRILNKAEVAFQDAQYDQALKLYQSVKASAPKYASIDTYIGDTYFRQGNYEKAQIHFEAAIKRNFIDYQAHWFFADMLWKMNERERAVAEITTAHLLNINHSEIKATLLKYRAALNRPWKDWEFNPQYVLNQDGDKVMISVEKDWLGYALVKALWKYEQGYAKNMVGQDYENLVVCFEEEKEAIVSLLAGTESFRDLKAIVEQGFVDEMIIYEILACKDPGSVLLLPQETFARLVDYANRYH